jgi:hypothetical protein
MAAVDLLLPLDKLVRPERNPTMYRADRTYTELGGFVEFMEQQYGLERLKRVWQQGSAKIPAIVGKPVSTLEEEWLAKLKREIAERN